MNTTRRTSPRSVAEERRFLDALVFWRALYARRGRQDREPIESVSTVIAGAVAAMRIGAAAPATQACP
ncbi:MAG TPA: hypothetical protein VM253_08575 [Candidatus Limnocylindrales bacterium]|nr:hypothetical protein [Candidatus Limnocylindrales bacterium]